MSRLRLAMAVSVASIGLTLAGLSVGLAQTSDSTEKQMEKDLGMDGQSSEAGLGFVDDISTLEECQSGCRAVIDKMLAKYKGRVSGGNKALGADDLTQLGAAIAVAAATLEKDEAATVQTSVATDLGPEAAAAYTSAYDDAVAPYAPK